jgi:antitoxin component YwqK of YwqJK toxin-antitoxin module
MKKIKLFILVIIAILATIIIFLFYFQNKEEITYYPDGKIKEIKHLNYKNELVTKESYSYDKNEIVVRFFSKNILMSFRVYNLKGDLKSEFTRKENTDLFFSKEIIEGKIIKGKGKIINDLPNGWWLYYDDNDNLIEKCEYINKNNELFLNQSIKFKDGKIDYRKSFFLDAEISKNGEYWFFNKINYYPLNKSKGTIFKVCYSEDIKLDFSNLENVKLDTINLRQDKKNKYNYFGSGYIRGFILEHSPVNPKDTLINAPIDVNQFRMYFEIKVD